MPSRPEAPTKSQVNKAGKLVRSALRGDAIDLVEFDRAIQVIATYRACHQYPLQKATMGLRSMVKSEGCAVEVSQRLKRFPTILDKIGREPTMQLANMQDIGGCRAVLASIDEVRRVQRRVAKNRPPSRISDYIEHPRDSGYRGVHLIVEYDDRMVEVQLRTKVMHEWAIAVERFSGRLQADLKSSQGPPEVLSFLALISEAMATEEQGETVTDELLAEMDRRRAAALPFLAGGRS